MPKKSKKKDKKEKKDKDEHKTPLVPKVHVIGKVEPKVLSTLVAEPVKEPHILAAVPKSAWQQFKDFFTS